MLKLPNRLSEVAESITQLDYFATSFSPAEAIARAAEYLGSSIDELEQIFDFEGDPFLLIGCYVGEMLQTDQHVIACREYLPKALHEYVLTEAEAEAMAV